MAIFTVGARLHDYGKGTPDELFGKVSADGFACVQLAYKKCVPGVASYADVTPRGAEHSWKRKRKHNIAVAVLAPMWSLPSRTKCSAAPTQRISKASWPCARR